MDGRALELDMAAKFVSGDTWELFVAPQQVPPATFEIPPDDTSHSVVWDKNRTASKVSDGLVVLGVDNGSTMCGEIEARFLTGPIVRPVLIAYHRDGHKISSAWRGLAADHPQVTLLPYGSDTEHYDNACAWMADVKDQVEASALARRALDAQYLPLCEALHHACTADDRADFVAFARRLGFEPNALLRLIATPMELASLGLQRFLQLTERYPDAAAGSTLMAEAQLTLEIDEMESWNAWADTVDRMHALRSLRTEVQRRAQLTGIFAPARRLAFPGAWAEAYGDAA